ncbi:SAF domain-containing protein [Knoellia locipacati]|uniref:SAF domain-containing protein n=1 Tax=Knoellia locipacati TaxID=882824 RepID=UPI00384B67F2
MPRFHLAALRRPEILGPSRRARWRRWALRRALAAACATAATLLLVGVVRPPPPPTTRVVVAAEALPGGGVLGEKDLRVVQVGRDSGLVATVADLRSLVGRRLASRVEPGEVITTTRLVPRSPLDGAPPGTVAAHLLVADAHALDLVSAGRRVTLYPDTGGAALAQDVLVLGVDTPGKASFTGSLPGGDDGARGLVTALEPAELERIFAGQRPDGGPPRVLAVVTG